MSNENKIEIKEFTVSDLKDEKFNIPIYQRPYAWSTKEVEVLLEDFFNAYEKNKDESYYIGNIVTFPNMDKLDIVDGQQRFTTLFLIGVIAGWEKNIELDYEIREKDRKFLKKVTKENINKEYKDVNYNLIENLKFIKTFFDNKNDDFKKWIYEKVKFILTKLNKDTDVNKYFEVMNNRGIQLEKHHILKAKLLEKIKDIKEQKKYAKIWDYCSDMNTYLEEYILKDEEDDKKIKEIRKNLLSNPLNIFEKYNHNEENLFDILKKDKKGIDKEANKEKNRNKNLYKSIINFETFLLHVYKITQDDKIKINDSNLLETIKVEKLDAKKFIKELLEYRILFDYFVFKRNKEEKSNIRLIDKEGNTHTNNNLLMIELLFEITSSKFNLWLSDFLKFVKENNIKFVGNKKDGNNNDIAELIKYLEEKDKEEAKKRIGDKKLEDILNQGTSTPHYWFYKLDYLLWKNSKYWKNVKVLKNYNIKNFRLKNLSSIEHIQPQNPEDECKNWGECNINNFGNLALISKNLNSKLSNQCFKNKKSDIEKQANNGKIDSLKMLFVYSKYEKWNTQNCEDHHTKMIKILCENLKS